MTTEQLVKRLRRELKTWGETPDNGGCRCYPDYAMRMLEILDDYKLEQAAPLISQQAASREANHGPTPTPKCADCDKPPNRCGCEECRWNPEAGAEYGSNELPDNFVRKG